MYRRSLLTAATRQCQWTSAACATTLATTTSSSSSSWGVSSPYNNNNNNNNNHDWRSVQHTCQRIQKRFKVFVSRHNKTLKLTANAILDVCQVHGIHHQHKQTASHVILRECPFCSKPTNDKASNMYKLYIENQTGAYFCHRCGTGGSWYDFKANLNGGYDGLKDSAPAPSYSYQSRNHGQRSTGKHPSVEQTPLPLPPARLSGYCSSRLLDPHQSNQDTNPVLDYLTQVRGLDRLTLRKYGVGRAVYKFPGDRGYEEAECVTFPWMLRESELRVQEDLREVQFPKEDDTEDEVLSASSSASSESAAEQQEPADPFVTRRIKVRAVQEKSWQRLDPAGGGWGLFGWHTVPPDATEIILTEGEYDAMAVHQGTGRLAVSLPNGCRSLPVQVLPLLERFEKIILWMDNDLPGQEGADKFAKKLGLNRSYIVRCREAKDANEALLKGLDMNSYLDAASLVPHDRIMTFSDLREDVLHELLKPDLYSGVPVPSLPKLTQLMKGFRRGELTVLTGPTGSGKTTFLGQVSLDMAEQGINVLWGSFEIKNTRLVHKLLKQYSRDLLPDIASENAEQAYNALCDRFGTLPFHFMGFHGGSEVDEVLDAMEYAVYVNDAEHIILDNMQFMITRNVAGASTWDKFDTQDIAIEKFRKFATEHNVHLTLVVHPRKEDEAAKLNISSFYGSAKATQEADTVLILQNDGRRKYIEVKKNRFDGTLGHVPLYYQSKSGRYVDHEGPGVEGVAPPQQQDTPKVNIRDHWEQCLTSRA